MKIHPRVFIVFFLVGLLTLTGGCATSQSGQSSANQSDQRNDRDPFERVNRAVLRFNLQVDRFVLKPAAKAYDKLPGPVRNGVGNFFSNLWLPNTIVNDLLQGKFAHAGRDTGRFMINTVIGFFGFMDPASELNLPEHKEDFGQTLAVWGAPSGPYLMLPFLGPSNLRDAVGLVPQYAATDAVSALDSPESWYAGGTRLVDARARRLDADELFELQPDKYLFLREGYRQWRNQLIYDGHPPDGLDGVDEDALLDELLEDEPAN